MEHAHFRYMRERVTQIVFEKGTKTKEVRIGAEGKILPMRVHWSMNLKTAVVGHIKQIAQNMGHYTLSRLRLRQWTGLVQWDVSAYSKYKPGTLDYAEM